MSIRDGCLTQVLALPQERLQSTLGFATMGLAANLDIPTATLLTDPYQYIIATLGITTRNFGPYVEK